VNRGEIFERAGVTFVNKSDICEQVESVIYEWDGVTFMNKSVIY